jgi:hypothetical protein
MIHQGNDMEKNHVFGFSNRLIEVNSRLWQQNRSAVMDTASWTISKLSDKLDTVFNKSNSNKFNLGNQHTSDAINKGREVRKRSRFSGNDNQSEAYNLEDYVYLRKCETWESDAVNSDVVDPFLANKELLGISMVCS